MVGFRSLEENKVLAPVTEEWLIRETHVRKLASERRITTFTLVAIAFAFIWILLVPIFSYEPSKTEFYIPPGTDLATPKTP